MVAVEPRLLQDVLCRTLEQEGFRVSTAVAGTVESYDLAVVSAGRERDVRATRVIPLDGDDLDLVALRSLLAQPD